MKKLLWIIIGITGIAAVLYGGFKAALDWRFDRDAPTPAFPAPTTMGEARAQDLAHLALFFDLERSFTQATRTRAKPLYDQLSATAESLSDAQFEMAVTRLVAAADNGHTKVREYSRTPRYNRLPIRGHLFDDGYWIIRAYAGHENLLGRKWVALDGRDLDEVLNALRPYVGGRDEIFRRYVPYLIESPELLHAIGLASEPEAIQLTLETADGLREQARLEAPFPPSSEHIARTHALLVPAVYSQSQPEWTSVYPADQEVPLYLRHAVDGFALEHLPASNAVYLQYWSNSDSATETVAAFQDRAREMLDQLKPEIIVLDQRFNSGGDYTNTHGFMRELPTYLADDGFMYIVTGPATFSAGSFSVAFAREAAGERGIIVGRRLADKIPNWGEDNLLRLPNSEIEIKFSTGKHNPWQGCSAWQDCFWLDFFYPVEAGSPEPDITIAFTFADYLAGRDPVLEEILGR